MRDAVGAFQPQTGRGLPHQIERGTHRLKQKVVFAGGNHAGAFSVDDDLEARVSHFDRQFVEQRQREAEGIESRPEVGTGGWHADANLPVDETHSSPAAFAAAWTSNSITIGSMGSR